MSFCLINCKPSRPWILSQFCYRRKAKSGSHTHKITHNRSFLLPTCPQGQRTNGRALRANFGMPEGTAGSFVWDVQVAFLTCSPLLGHLHQSLSDVSQDLKGGRENTQGMSKFAFLAKLTKKCFQSNFCHYPGWEFKYFRKVIVEIYGNGGWRPAVLWRLKKRFMATPAVGGGRSDGIQSNRCQNEVCVAKFFNAQYNNLPVARTFIFIYAHPQFDAFPRANH